MFSFPAMPTRHLVRALHTMTRLRLKVACADESRRVPNFRRAGCLPTAGPSPRCLASSFQTAIPTPDFSRGDRSLTLTLGTSRLELPYVWLRDNCRCDVCYSHVTNQKNVRLQDIDLDVAPARVALADEVLTLTWPDGHVTTHTLPFLRRYSFPCVDAPKDGRVLWDGRTLTEGSLPRVGFEYLLEEDEGLRELLASLVKYGVGLVTGVPTDLASTQRAVERVAFVQKTTYGEMWAFTSDGCRQDLAYSNMALGAHTDTSYFNSPCGIQVFHCTYFDGDGGESLLVDGFKAAEDLRSTNPAVFEMLCNTQLHHENRDDDHCHFRSLAPILKTHPITKDLENIRYNHYDRCPISTVPPSKIRKLYESIAKLGRLLERTEGEMWIKLKPGMVIFIDNWRVLHGRAAFTGTRTMTGCYLSRDDWLSKARQLGLFWN